jgi:ATP adenylyltransferase
VDDEERHVLARGERCFVMLNAFPYNSGHVMVSPLRHVASIENLGDDEALELMALSRRALRALRETYRPDGFNLGVNEGEVAGAGFAGHVHLHVVPRWAADSNFMAVTADTRVLPQSLDDSYQALRERFAWPNCASLASVPVAAPDASRVSRSGTAMRSARGGG